MRAWILVLLRGFCARIRHPCIAPDYLHCPHYCNTGVDSNPSLGLGLNPNPSAALPVKELKKRAAAAGLDTVGCVEKGGFVALLVGSE